VMKMIRSLALTACALLAAASLPAAAVEVEQKVYPAATPTGSQRTEDEVVPLSWARGQLDRLEKETPEGERSTLEVRGWRLVSVWRRHTLTPVEVLQQQVQELARRQQLVLSELQRGEVSEAARQRLVELLRAAP